MAYRYQSHKMNYRRVVAKFKNGRELIYTDGVLYMLMTDPQVEWVKDEKTGEVLYSAQAEE